MIKHVFFVTGLGIEAKRMIILIAWEIDAIIYIKESQLH